MKFIAHETTLYDVIGPPVLMEVSVCVGRRLHGAADADGRGWPVCERGGRRALPALLDRRKHRLCQRHRHSRQSLNGNSITLTYKVNSKFCVLDDGYW